ncbi:MAG: aminotransferase class I/II-fold pyridoxal phosphate-dependent enzyme [Caldilineaceae bacterium]|nr:aminotransferase class I/II-fold pyridoxal phosphate-dependent enzyme [Caldilineaceae bacterium]
MPTTALGRAVAKRAQHWLTTPPPDPIDSGSSTSAEVRAAVQQAMTDHLCDHYTRRPGIAPLCKAIAAHMQAHGLEADADNGVVVTGGVDETRYVALHALAPGKIVYIAQPGPNYAETVLALAGIEAQALNVNAELPAVEDALLLVDPAQLSADAQSQLAEWAVAYDVTVIADESDLSFFAEGHRPFAQHPGCAQRTLTVGSFKGADSIDHWQVAWFGGPKKLAVAVRDLKQAMTISSPAPAQYAALAAVKQMQEADA